MEKESAIIGEYIVEIDEKVTVYRIYQSTMAALREVAAMKNFTIQPTWFCRMLGSKLIEAFGDGGNSVTIGEYYIQKDPDKRINVYRTYSDTMQGLNEIARKIKLAVEDGWDEMTLAKNIIEFSNNSKQ